MCDSTLLDTAYPVKYFHKWHYLNTCAAADYCYIGP